jgi:hypothetical protein
MFRGNDDFLKEFILLRLAFRVVLQLLTSTASLDPSTLLVVVVVVLLLLLPWCFCSSGVLAG